MKIWCGVYTILPYWFGYHADATGYHELGLGKIYIIWETKK